MAETVQLREPNATVRGLLESALRQHGYEPVGPDQGFERFCVFCVDPSDNEADLLGMMDELPIEKQVLLLVLREQDTPETVRAHDRVAGVLVKPVTPRALGNALGGTPEPVERVPGRHERATAELATVPHTAAYSAIGEQRLKAFIRSEQITGESQSLWRALAFEIALKVPEWAAIEREAERAVAISEWLKDRIDG